ncbi:MAG: ABC-F family ATP-binding cassette domain-containing protein [Phycisphaeraceae bacterium]|nr:ABC-F family ATP-binding cassette domain-containing protein [Phycisphaeraceae bacterium]
MAILTAANIHLSLGTRVLLDGVNLNLSAGQRLGLVGRNGCGKSTFLKLLAGVEGIRPDAGQIQPSRNATVGYLPQDAEVQGERTLWEEAVAAMGNLQELHEHAEAVARQMAETGDDDELARLMKRYEQLEHQIEAGGGYAVEHRIEETLHGVGLGSELFQVRADKLSGGQRGRLALARLLLNAPDVLLLDEPTNHLDIEGRQWLETYLRECNEAVVLVSHDRWLLNRIVDGIAELEQGKLMLYPGDYESFREQRALHRLTQNRAYEKQQEMFRREQAFIDRYKAGQRARQAKGRERRLERQMRDEALERPVELGELNLGLRSVSRCGDKVIEAEGLSKSYPGKPLFGGLDLLLRRGDCLGVIGPNGAGKTTVVNCLLSELEPTAGKVRIGSGVSVGYFRQMNDHLDLSRTVVEYLRPFVADNTEQQARDLAGAFLFSGQEQDKPLGVLSGGERSRAVLAGLLASGHNLLVLDEPTNHLDLSASERLEEFLIGFSTPQRNSEGVGTLILITHDRMLLTRVAKRLLILDGQGHARLFDGNYEQYLQSLASRIQRDATASGMPLSGAGAGGGGAAGGGKGEGADGRSVGGRDATVRTNSRTDTKTKPRKAGGALTKLSDAALEKRIAELEAKLAKIDEQMMDPAVLRDGEKARELHQQRQHTAEELEPLEDEWLRRGEMPNA